MKTLAIFPFEEADLEKIDSRLIPFTTGWLAKQTYKGKTVYIPGTWDSHFKIINYFQVVKSPDSPNPGEDENEIGLRIEGGWFPYDTEVIINLRITGKNVLNPNNSKVSAEILKPAGSKIRLTHNGTFVTDFTKKRHWWKTPKDKIWIDNMHNIGNN